MIQATGMTVDEINELANKIGITIPVTYQEPPDFNIKDVKFTTAAQVIAHRYKGEAPDPRDPSKNVSVDYS